MKTFESFLAPQLNAYIAYREGLGYSTQLSRAYLLVLDRYLRETNADWRSLQPSYFLEMSSKLDVEHRTVNRIFSSMRVFFRFLLRQEYMIENPLQDIPPLRENTIVPFVFSPDQMDQLLQAFCKRMHRNQNKTRFLTDYALYLAVLLLARCGMRISEPLKMMIKHYRRSEGTLFIERTKFRKQRLIPIPKAVMTDIGNYLSVRRSLRPGDPNPYLLAGNDDGPLTDEQIRYVFHRVVKEIGLDQKRKVIGNTNFSHPTPHSLRHSFAVNTVIKVKQRGQSPQSALPVLAAYLGHSQYEHTTVYLRVADAQSRKNLVDFSLWQIRRE
jgi:site-specific recombinase XerD